MHGRGERNTSLHFLDTGVFKMCSHDLFNIYSIYIRVCQRIIAEDFAVAKSLKCMLGQLSYNWYFKETKLVLVILGWCSHRYVLPNQTEFVRGEMILALI